MQYAFFEKGRYMYMQCTMASGPKPQKLINFGEFLC